MFGFTIVRKEYLAELERQAMTHCIAVQCHRWFAGWRDLDIIWDYIFRTKQFGGISEAREKYAEARGTDVYGQPLPERTAREESDE